MVQTINNWEKQDNWQGNPSLGYDSFMKNFKFENHKPIPVYVFGCSEPINQKDAEGYEWITHGFNFCVSAGANSDLSYSGGFPDEIKYDIQKCLDYVDKLYAEKRLIY
jgi:hypothetical protein